MNWLELILGALLGWGVPKAFSSSADAMGAWRLRRRWKSVNLGWAQIRALFGRLELVQDGWRQGEFDEHDILITLDGAYALPDDVRLKVLEPSRFAWESQGFKDGIQCGIKSIHIVRTTDETVRSEPAHEISIVAHSYRYFEAKATNLGWFEQGRPDLLRVYAADARHDAHAAMFPTPLSVGLSLFCEGGRFLVLTRRTANPAAGGHLSAGQYFNAVGENCAPVDTEGETEGRPRLSIFRTATRGLLEEMGLEMSQVDQVQPTLHSLAWDTGILDYKFFGYVTCALAQEEVRAMWRQASDRSESRELVFVDVHDTLAATQLVDQMRETSEQWSDEARFGTIMSLVHVGRLSIKELAYAAGQERGREPANLARSART